MKARTLGVGALLIMGLAVPTEAAKPMADAPNTGGQSESLTDAKVLGAALVADQSEIDQGKLARTRALDGTVRAFAVQIVTDQMAAKKQAESVSEVIDVTPEPSATSAALKKRSDDLLAALGDTKPKDFDRAYVKAEVAEHEHLLSVIDSELLPGANSPQLRSLLGDMHSLASRHLQAAQSTLRDLSVRVTE